MMIKQTINKSVSVLMFALLLVAGVNLVPSPVHALDPGCYIASEDTQTSVACGDDDLQNQVDNEDKCFLAPVSAPNGTPIQGPFAEVDCRSVDTIDQVTGAGLDPINPDFDDSRKGCNEAELNEDNCRIIEYLVNGINVLTALAGMAIIGSIMIAGFQYMTARDNSGQIQQARTRIIWALTALFILIFTYALLNFLVPGGVL